MQAMNKLVPLLLVAFPMKSAAQGPEEKKAEGAGLIRVQVEYVEMAHAAITGLLYETDATESDATALRKEIEAMLKKGDAKVVETTVATGRSGERETAESTQEITYATEYEAGAVVDAVNLPDRPNGLTAEDLRALDGMVHPARPASFQTRKVGSILEFEAELSKDGKTIDLHLEPSLVWFTGNRVWNERKDRSGNVSKIEMPVFYSIHLDSWATLIDGKPVLSAVISPKDDAGKIDSSRKLMIFVKAVVQEVK
jgi:hypothetical protein